jgi:creatinine deaminase
MCGDKNVIVVRSKQVNFDQNGSKLQVKTRSWKVLEESDKAANFHNGSEHNRVVIGDVTNASGNEQLARDKGVQVDILEDQKGIALCANYRREKPDQDNEDSKGLAEVQAFSTR